MTALRANQMTFRVGEVGRAFLLGFVPTLLLTAATAANAAGFGSTASVSSTYGMASFNHAFTAVTSGTGGATFVSTNTYMGGSPLFYFNLKNTSTQPAAMTGSVSGNVVGISLIPSIVVKTCSVAWVSGNCAPGAVTLGNYILTNSITVNWGTQPVDGIVYVQVSMGSAIANVVVTATSSETSARAGIDRTAG